LPKTLGVLSWRKGTEVHFPEKAIFPRNKGKMSNGKGAVDFARKLVAITSFSCQKRSSLVAKNIRGKGMIEIRSRSIRRHERSTSGSGPSLAEEVPKKISLRLKGGTVPVRAHKKISKNKI